MKASKLSPTERGRAAASTAPPPASPTAKTVPPMPFHGGERCYACDDKTYHEMATNDTFHNEMNRRFEAGQARARIKRTR